MSTHQLDQAVFRPTLPEDIDFEPFPSFPPPARLAVVVGRPSEPAPYVVRVKLAAYPPGAVVVLPGGTPHFHWAKSGEYITQVTAFGPISLDYVDPADDPRNT
jgi:hypothetical protein